MNKHENTLGQSGFGASDSAKQGKKRKHEDSGITWDSLIDIGANRVPLIKQTFQCEGGTFDEISVHVFEADSLNAVTQDQNFKLNFQDLILYRKVLENGEGRSQGPALYDIVISKSKGSDESTFQNSSLRRIILPIHVVVGLLREGVNFLRTMKPKLESCLENTKMLETASTHAKAELWLGSWKLPKFSGYGFRNSDKCVAKLRLKISLYKGEAYMDIRYTICRDSDPVSQVFTTNGINLLFGHAESLLASIENSKTFSPQQSDNALQNFYAGYRGLNPIWDKLTRDE